MILEDWKKEIKRLRKLRKILRKLYHENDQTLYVTSIEEWDNNSNVLDIFVTDKEGKELKSYLFTIVNLDALNTLDLGAMRCPYIDEPEFYEYFDVERAISPLYFDRTFTLKKFTPITEKDVIYCCKYFIEKVLQEFWIWNIEFLKKP